MFEALIGYQANTPRYIDEMDTSDDEAYWTELSHLGVNGPNTLYNQSSATNYNESIERNSVHHLISDMSDFAEAFRQLFKEE